jgi:enoyl-CoA hydratase/carnithine racemase
MGKISNLAATSNYDMITVEKAGANGNIGLITLNRPKALNALCKQLMDELANSLENMDKDSSINAIVITGSEKAFAGLCKVELLEP